MRDMSLLDVAARVGTPVYVYDRCRLRSRVAEIRAAFNTPDFVLLFATMANPLPELLREMKALNVGACVNSVLHLQTALACGIPAEVIQFTSTGVSAADMRTVLDAGVRINIDSISQLDAWFGGVGGHRAGLRINAGSLSGTNSGGADRIGIEVDRIDEAVAIANAHSAVVDGIHVYVGTNFQAPDEMLPILEELFRVGRRASGLAYVNIGGGIGVDYGQTGCVFDLSRFGAEIERMCSWLSTDLGRPVQLFFEPGRGLAAAAGVFLCSVTDIKALHGQRFVAVDASIALFPRPFHHPDSPHAVRRLNWTGSASIELCDAVVVGRTTFSRDILARSKLPADLRVGEVLAFSDAGAYCNSMTSRFLGQAEAQNIFVDSDLS
jgi:diaminopimelate decarboxylase